MAAPETPRDDSNEELWRLVLTGQNPALLRARRLWKYVPSDPRCKMCASPFGGVGSILAKLMRHGPMPRNPLLCGFCYRSISKHPGGAEVEMTVLFADVRNSTAVAEGMSASKYTRLLERFYRVASEAVTTHDGIVDKFLGDGVMALFIPALTGEDHAGRAIAAARGLLARLDSMPDLPLPVGIGIHTGLAYAGLIGSHPDSHDEGDFTALGDVVNVAARLGSVAAAHQILASRSAASSARVGDGAPSRTVEIRGRSEPLEVVELAPERL